LEKIRHATIKMTDYYPLIARAVEELGRSTGEARQSLYERARNAVAQLRSNPALLEADIAKEYLALEEAIHKVEAETAGKSRTETRTEPQSAVPIGLSAGETDMQRNEQLLKDRPWFDIPIVYTNGGRALLAMEKGPPGARAFAEAFAVWEKEIAPGTE
jgi:hypothetical protein